MKLLAVDDNADNLLTLKALLRAFLPEALLMTSQSGADGIRRAVLEQPDTILLDIQMPGMDGFEVTARLKEDRRTQHIPIILITAHKTDAALRVRGLEIGADAFLSKPLDEAELVAQIKAMVRIKTSEDALRFERDALDSLVAKRTHDLMCANVALKEHLERLAESEERYCRAVRGTSDGLWDWNMRTGEYYVSDRWKELLGFDGEEIPHKVEFFLSRLHPGDAALLDDALQSHLRQGTPYDIELRAQTKDGEFRFFRCRGHADHAGDGEAFRMAGAISDVTDQKRMEEQLRHAQKMDAVGQLAGGVAHDFNNILTVISGYANILKMELEQEGRPVETVEHIVAASERAAHLTRSLLAFSRKQAIAPQKVDLRTVVQHVEKFLGRIIGEDIQLETRVSPDALPVYVDTGQIEQILINLAANSRDAMTDGGVLKLSAERTYVDQSYVRAGFCEVAGHYSVLTVTDTGVGMDEATRKRVFEPFFTTKETGKGTGLGMSIVYAIVQQHKGFVTLHSQPQKGTSCRVFLPLVQEIEMDGVRSAHKMVPETGSETILVAEDDATVRALVERVLKTFGYRVILSEDGQDAVDKFFQHRDLIDLILMDIVMPRKNGMQAYSEIRGMQPEAKVLFTSGYTADFIEKRGVESGVEVIMKPVQPMELLRRVREVLEK